MRKNPRRDLNMIADVKNYIHYLFKKSVDMCDANDSVEIAYSTMLSVNFDNEANGEFINSLSDFSSNDLAGEPFVIPELADSLLVSPSHTLSPTRSLKSIVLPAIAAANSSLPRAVTTKSVRFLDASRRKHDAESDKTLWASSMLCFSRKNSVLKKNVAMRIDVIDK